jgi:hypothetical protein
MKRLFFEQNKLSKPGCGLILRQYFSFSKARLPIFCCGPWLSTAEIYNFKFSCFQGNMVYQDRLSEGKFLVRNSLTSNS